MDTKRLSSAHVWVCSIQAHCPLSLSLAPASWSFLLLFLGGWGIFKIVCTQSRVRCVANFSRGSPDNTHTLALQVVVSARVYSIQVSPMWSWLQRNCRVCWITSSVNQVIKSKSRWLFKNYGGETLAWLKVLFPQSRSYFRGIASWFEVAYSPAPV